MIHSLDHIDCCGADCVKSELKKKKSCNSCWVMNLLVLTFITDDKLCTLIISVTKNQVTPAPHGV